MGKGKIEDGNEIMRTGWQQIHCDWTSLLYHVTVYWMPFQTPLTTVTAATEPGS